MRFMKVAATAVGLFAATTATSGSALANCDAGEMVIKFSHVVKATGHPKGDASTLLAKRVNAEMNGKACMEVFPNSTLYNDNKVMEALLIGDVQLAAPSLSKFEAYTLKFRVFDLPFMFKDQSAFDTFTTSAAGQELLSAPASSGYQGLGYWFSGMKQFTAKKPLIAPTDAKGFKFRVQTSDVAVAMIEAMGGSAQKLAFKEVYGALQTGVVDGQENSWSNIYTKKFFEVQDGVTETNHQVLAYLLVNEVTLEANAAVGAKESMNRANILKSGGTIRELTAAQRKVWVDTMSPVWKKFTKDIGADLVKTAASASM